MTTSATLPQIDETVLATTRYLQALTVLDDDSVRRPSALPGWSRAHVVAHLARNADAFTAVVRAACAGEPAAMYGNQAQRDRDIEVTVERHDLAGLVQDSLASIARLTDALWSCDADPETPYSRLPDSQPTFPLHTVGPRRRAEVEIHHADLELDYRPSEWPTDFSCGLIRQRREELAGQPEKCPAMVLVSTDVEGSWEFGRGDGPEISGSVGDLAWWLVGRGGGRGLTCSRGALPTLERWR